MKIQDIIDELDQLAVFETYDIPVIVKTDIKQFLKYSLTSLLDSIEKDLPKRGESDDVSDRYYCNNYRQEVINIINSHK